MFTRRSLLFVPGLAFSAPARAREVLEETRTTLAGVALPASRARKLAGPVLGGQTAFVAAFAADTEGGVRDLFAVVAAGRVVALEVLAWHGADESRLSTRLSVVNDGVRLRLQRDATARQGHGWRHEAWTDYLGWRDAEPMADCPVRPVLAGTWQAALAAERRAMQAVLTVGPRDIGPALVAACPVPAFT